MRTSSRIATLIPSSAIPTDFKKILMVLAGGRIETLSG